MISAFVCERCGLLFDSSLGKKRLCNGCRKERLKEASKKYNSRIRREAGVSMHKIIICKTCGNIFEGHHAKVYCKACITKRESKTIMDWGKRNQDKIAIIKKRYRESVYGKEASKSYYRNNRDRIIKRTGEYAKVHRDANRKAIKRWEEKNPTYYSNRRAKRRAIEGSFSKEDVDMLFWDQGGYCNSCGSLLSNGYHVDHIYPLFPREGYTHGTNRTDNLQLLCVTCNLQKGNKDPSQINFNEWAWSPLM